MACPWQLSTLLFLLLLEIAVVWNFLLKKEVPEERSPPCPRWSGLL